MQQPIMTIEAGACPAPVPLPDCAEREWTRMAIARLQDDGRRSADTHLLKPLFRGLKGISVYLKDESTHPTGSLKHRLGRSLFLYGICNGKIRQNTTLVEASSGSTAVSEAYFAHVDEALRRTDALVGGVLGTTMIYSRQTWMDAHFTEAQQRRWSSVGRLGYWAHYNSAITKPWIPAGWKDEPFPVSEYALWQYTSTGTWPGVKRAVDIGRSRPGQDFNALLLNTDPQQPNPSPVPVPDTTHIVTASALNVRQWPWVGTLEPPKVGTPLVGGTAVKLFGVLPPIAGSPAGSFGWGLISAAGNQWVSMKYLAPK